MPLEITPEQKERWTRKQSATLWGQPHEIEPYFVEAFLGDGMQLVAITPLNTRPNYYLIRVDSKWWMRPNHYTEPDLDEKDAFYEHIDEILEAIEEEVGGRWEEDDDGVLDMREWPALDDSGVSWCTAMDLLAERSK